MPTWSDKPKVEWHPYDDACHCKACVVEAINRMVACGLVERTHMKKYRLTTLGRAFVSSIKAEQDKPT